MKKLFFCALAAIVSLQVASAQKRGEMYVGGSLGVTTASASIDGISASATSFGFAPEFGYFVADRLRLSGSIAYNLTSSGDTSHALTIGPSVAYYVRLCDRFYYTPEAGIGFAYASAYGANGYGFATGLKFGAFEFRPASIAASPSACCRSSIPTSPTPREVTAQAATTCSSTSASAPRSASSTTSKPVRHPASGVKPIQFTPDGAIFRQG